MTMRDARRRMMRPLVAVFVVLATLHGLSGMSCPHVGAAARATSPAAASPSHTAHGLVAHHGESASHSAGQGERGHDDMPGCQCPGACVCAPLAVANVVPAAQWPVVVAHDAVLPAITLVAPATRSAWLLPPATAPPALLAPA